MAETFYHVDRWTDLTAGQTITLEPLDGADPSEAAVADVYPEGLSRHGRHYCSEDLYSDDPDDVWDVACEVIFEAARLARYPDRPSRLQSVFALESLDDVDAFVDRFVESSCDVWAVEADDAFVGDMNLVDAEDLADGLSNADRYWRGGAYNDDPLREVLLTPPVTVVENVARIAHS